MDIAYENKTIYSNVNGQFVALVENGTIYQVNSFPLDKKFKLVWFNKYLTN